MTKSSRACTRAFAILRYGQNRKGEEEEGEGGGEGSREEGKSMEIWIIFRRKRKHGWRKRRNICVPTSH
jgi:hypothetical protein